MVWLRPERPFPCGGPWKGIEEGHGLASCEAKQRSARGAVPLAEEAELDRAAGPSTAPSHTGIRQGPHRPVLSLPPEGAEFWGPLLSESSAPEHSSHAVHPGLSEIPVLFERHVVGLIANSTQPRTYLGSVPVKGCLGQADCVHGCGEWVA